MRYAITFAPTAQFAFSAEIAVKTIFSMNVVTSYLMQPSLHKKIWVSSIVTCRHGIWIGSCVYRIFKKFASTVHKSLYHEQGLFILLCLLVTVSNGRNSLGLSYSNSRLTHSRLVLSITYRHGPLFISGFAVVVWSTIGVDRAKNTISPRC
jgi:hypothetical protein